MLDYWWHIADVPPCDALARVHPREQEVFAKCVMPRYPAPLVELIDYSYINGVDGQFIQHLFGPLFSDQERVEKLRALFHERQIPLLLNQRSGKV